MDGSFKQALPGGRDPRVWVLSGRRTGDNMQLEALAEALGWPWERKDMAWRKLRIGRTALYGQRASLGPLVAEARRRIVPPWPELVLSIGWRSVPVARWIGRQSGARLVHLGRPRAPLRAFDLVLSTPQYGLPDAPNLVRLSGPLSGLSPERLKSAAEEWRGHLAHLPRPWIAVLVGGSAPPLLLTTEAAAELGAKVSALARERGGSLLVATGPRTGRAATDALLERVDAPMHSYIWGEEGKNPYTAYLALADEIVITGESVSMAHEASHTGKPLHILDLPYVGRRLLGGVHGLDSRLRTRDDLLGRRYLDLVRNGWICPPRRPEAHTAALLRSGQAVRLGDGSAPVPGRESSMDIVHAVEAVRRLFTR